MNTGLPPRRFLDPAGCIPGDSRPRRALFLDRDGVINVNLGYVHLAAQTRWVPGIFELCRAASAAGYLIIVVTNQAGIARGLYTESQFLEYTRWMHTSFQQQCAPLAATFYCPHHPSVGQGQGSLDCDCRKPKPGMLLAAVAEFELSAADSLMIGDSESDMLAAETARIGRRFLFDPAEGCAGHGNAPVIGSLSQIPSVMGWKT